MFEFLKRKKKKLSRAQSKTNKKKSRGRGKTIRETSSIFLQHGRGGEISRPTTQVIQDVGTFHTELTEKALIARYAKAT